MPSRRAVLMTRQAISPRLAIRILENIRSAHLGLRLSRNARMPSSASSVVHCAATCSPIRSAASASCGRASSSGISSLISRCTEGAPSVSSWASVATVSSSWSPLTTWSTRPMRSAVSASNMPPCIRSWRARRGPTASISTGMAMPASRPLRTEVRPKRADEEATAKSQASIRPTPPPTADAMDAGDRRLGKIVDRLHRAHHGVGADPPGDGVEPGPGQHPVEVAAGREGTAFAADDQHAHRVVGGKGLDGVDDGTRGVAVEGVHLRRAGSA